MNADERNAKIESYFREDMELLKDKGHDYSGDQDSLGNLRRFGLYGIIVRLSDKFSRLEQYAKSGELKVKDEGVIDTLRDIRNYAFLAQIFAEMDAIDATIRVNRRNFGIDDYLPEEMEVVSFNHGDNLPEDKKPEPLDHGQLR